MKILTLQIKKNYLDEILSGEKTEEFREIRPKNSKKYIEYFTAEDGEEDVRPLKYDAIQFFNGYAKDRAEAVVKIEDAEIEYIIDEDGNYIEFEENGETFITAQMVYLLGEVISIK